MSNNGIGIEFILPYEAEHNISFMNVRSATTVDIEEFQSFMGAYTTLESSKIINKGYSFDSLVEQTQAYARGMDRIIKLADFDVIHSHDWLTVSAALRAKQLSGKPLIMHVHATEFDRSAGKSGNQFVHELEFLGMSMADKVITVSDYTRDLVIEKYGIDPNKVTTVHNRIDSMSEVYSQTEDENPYQSLRILREAGYKVVTYVGRITVQKGLWNLLHAFAKVVSSRPKTILLIAGSGEQIRELQILAADLGIAQNVLFTNQFVNGSKWRNAFICSDLFVMPSISEPFGLTPLEAALFGTASLITKQCGVSELFQNTLKVDFWDENEMANQICSALNSEGFIETLSHNAYIEATQMTWDDAAKSVGKVYRESYV